MDSAAALVTDGRYRCGLAQESGLPAVNPTPSFPDNPQSPLCIAEAGLSNERRDFVGLSYEKPFIKFERLIETYLESRPRGFHSSVEHCRVASGQDLQKKRSTKGSGKIRRECRYRQFHVERVRAHL